MFDDEAAADELAEVAEVETFVAAAAVAAATVVVVVGGGKSFESEDGGEDLETLEPQGALWLLLLLLLFPLLPVIFTFLALETEGGVFFCCCGAAFCWGWCGLAPGETALPLLADVGVGGVPGLFFPFFTGTAIFLPLIPIVVAGDPCVAEAGAFGPFWLVTLPLPPLLWGMFPLVGLGCDEEF